VPVFTIEYHGCKWGIAGNIGQVKGQVFDRNGNIVVGAEIEISIDGIRGVVPTGRSNEAGWYEWALTPGQKIRFLTLKVRGQFVRFSPAGFEVVSQAGCFHRVNFRQQ